MRRGLWTYWALVQAGYSVMGAVVIPYLRTLGLDPARLGVYQSVNGVAGAVGSLGGGVVGDRWGRREAIVLARFLHLASVLVLLAARRWEAVLAVAVLSGLAQMAGPAFSALVAGASGGSSRATFFGGLQTVAWVMGAALPLVGGFVADRWGARVTVAVSLPFFVVALGVAAALGVRGSRAPEAPPTSSQPGGEQHWRQPAGGAEARAVRGVRWRVAWEGMWVPGMRSTVVGLTVGQLINAAANGIINLALPLWVQDYLGGGYAEIAGASSAIAVGSAVTIYLGGRLADRYGRKRIGTFCLLWAGLVLAASPLVKTVWHLYALLFLLCLVANAVGPALSAVSAECVRPSVRATFSGLLQGLWWGGLAAGGALGGFLYTRGPAWVWMAIMVCGVLQVLTWQLLVRETLGREVPEAGAVAPAALAPVRGTEA
ncbi:MAG: MFS transporter [Bacillota bacterium]|nr:MFS transporter [Bacillota bacterium]